MPITFHPSPGQILHCDFSKGFVEPEMVKSARPVVVLSARGKLVTVVPLSTVEPTTLAACHYKMQKGDLPQIGRFQSDDSWIKGDMVYTVGFHRLDLIQLNKRDPISRKRVYFSRVLPVPVLVEIKKCVLHGLNMGQLAAHL